MSCGIYKITNLLNEKCYIGCSKNIEHRWIAHKSESIIEKNIQYNYSIHKAFRKYGIDNFKFEIIELVPELKLYEREKYWIKHFNSYEDGYNETYGGDSGPVKYGEENGNSILTEAEVFSIRQSILEGKMLSEVYPLYSDKISHRGFSHIWQGDVWKNVLPEAIEYVHSPEYMKKIKSFAGQKGISEEKKKIWSEIIRRKANGENRLVVYEDYKNIYSIGGFNKVWYKKC